MVYHLQHNIPSIRASNLGNAPTLPRTTISGRQSTRYKEATHANAAQLHQQTPMQVPITGSAGTGWQGPFRPIVRAFKAEMETDGYLPCYALGSDTSRMGVGFETSGCSARSVGALAHTEIVVLGLKYINSRERPLQNADGSGLWQGGDSFPSGHAATSWAGPDSALPAAIQSSAASGRGQP